MRISDWSSDVCSSDLEEFPYFREFWLKKPQPGSRSIEIYALLDSESVTGAYHFQLTPGNESVMEVRTCLYTRAAVEKLGIARSEEHTSELQSLMRISYAVFCLKKTKAHTHYKQINTIRTYT